MGQDEVEANVDEDRSFFWLTPDIEVLDDWPWTRSLLESHSRPASSWKVPCLLFLSRILSEHRVARLEFRRRYFLCPRSFLRAVLSHPLGFLLSLGAAVLPRTRPSN